jgi:hypothetical protein
MDETFVTYGGEVRYIEGFGREIWRKSPLGRSRRRWEDYIKADLQEIGR